MAQIGHDRSSPIILVIDDDAKICSLVTDILEDEGYSVSSVANGDSALNYLRATTALPHLILLDISMPGKDGIAFRELQLTDPRLREIPIVLLSGNTLVDQVATELHIPLYIRKPFHIDKLLEVVSVFVPRPETNL